MLNSMQAGLALDLCVWGLTRDSAFLVSLYSVGIALNVKLCPQVNDKIYLKQNLFFCFVYSVRGLEQLVFIAVYIPTGKIHPLYVFKVVARTCQTSINYKFIVVF